MRKDQDMKRSGKAREKRARSNGPTLFPFEDEAQEVASSLPIKRWDIPRSWAWTTVGEVAEVKKGMVRTPRNRPGMNAAKYLRAANITEDGLDLTNVEVMEMDFDAEEREVFALRVADIVLSEASGSPEQVGKPAIWNGELPLCCFQNTVLRFRPMGVSSQFALIVFQHYAENGLFADVVRGVGIGHLGSERFAAFPFPVPPRGEQDRIVAEFTIQAERGKSALGSLRSAKDKMGLQRLAIVSRELGGGRKDRKVALPPGWNKAKIGELCEVVNGHAFKSSEWQESGMPIIRIQNLRDKDAPFNYFGGEVEDKHLVNDGDLLFAWSGTPGTSFGAFIWHGIQGALNQHIFKLTPDESRVNREFLYHAINVNLADYVAAAQGGGGLAHLKRNQFVSSEVAIPPLKEQSRIVSAIKGHEKTLDEQEAVVDQNIARTMALRQSLLTCAVEGKLVKQDKKEGSASSLVAECRSNLEKYIKELAKRRQTARGSVVAKKSTNATQPKKGLFEVLVEEGPLLPRDLLRKAGYREENAGDVEEFYRLLHAAHQNKRIVEDTKGGRDQAKLKAVV